MQGSGSPDVKTLLGYRSRTDYTIPHVWILLPVLNYLFWAALPWVIFLGALSGNSISSYSPVLGSLVAAGLLASVTSAYPVYLLMNRRNTHFAREKALFGEVLAGLGDKVRPEDANAQLSLSSTYRYYAWLAESSGEKSALFQAFLAMIPYVGWLFLLFSLVFLTDDWKEHEKREDFMVQELNKTLSVMGYPAVSARLRQSQVRYRSTALFVLLSIFTLGLVELVWLYLSMGDPREHLEFHNYLEGSLATLAPQIGAGETLA